MVYETVLAQSFSWSDRRRLQCRAIFICLLVALSISTALVPYLGPLPSSQENETKKVEPLCTTDSRADYCVMNGDLRTHAKSSSVFLATFPGAGAFGSGSWAIRPYALKVDMRAMSRVREWNILRITEARRIPRCTQNHSILGVLFSTGGYSGNNFHDFSDIIIPLFLTTRQFKGEVRFLVTDYNPWWVWKYRVILENLSQYELININKEHAEVHCFPRMTIGLEHHKELIIDSLRSPYSMKDFGEFLRNVYSLKKSTAIRMRDGEHRRPRLLIIFRKRTRTFINGARIARLAESLGYEVIAAEAGPNTTRNAETVNSCDVIMGVHRAGLTNSVFMPGNAVLIQVVPLGGMEWHSKVCYGNPTRSMNISYLEYQITEQESSLVHEYPADHIVLKDPKAFHKGSWRVFKSVYLDKQNVELDLDRFKSTLLKALELLQGL